MRVRTSGRQCLPAILIGLRAVDTLTVKINRALAAVVKTAGITVELDKDKVIPTGGYLVVTENNDGSAIVVPGGAQDATPKDTDRPPAGLLYNVIAKDALPNLETFLANGGTIDLVAPSMREWLSVKSCGVRMRVFR